MSFMQSMRDGVYLPWKKIAGWLLLALLFVALCIGLSGKTAGARFCSSSAPVSAQRHCSWPCIS